MRIVHLIYTQAVAGAEKYLVNLLPGLKQYNIECDLICVCPQSSVPVLTAYCDMMNAKGIKSSLLIGKRKNFVSVAKSINSYLKKEKISIIHSHLSNADLIAVLIKVIFNSKIFIISTKHGYDEKYLIKYSGEAKRHKIDKNVYYYFTKFLLSQININLAISKAISNLYHDIKLARTPYHYIHHGIPEMPPIKMPDKIANQIIIAGRLEKMKGHKYLLDAIPEVIRSIPDVKLLILGDGSERYQLEEEVTLLGITDAVSFKGFQSDPYPYILQSDVIILPSLFEPFGLVYIEAFALKVPVVAFDVPAANEIIKNNDTGMLVPKSNVDSLAQKIIFLLQNPGERKKISDAAYQEFLNRYTADRMITETAEWYKNLKSYSL